MKLYMKNNGSNDKRVNNILPNREKLNNLLFISLLSFLLLKLLLLFSLL